MNPTTRSSGRYLTALALAACTAISLPANSPDRPGELEWFHGPFAAAQAKAKATQMPMLVYFWKDGSKLCGQLYTESLATPDAASALSDYVCYSAQLEHGSDLFHQFNVKTMPTVLMLAPDGQIEDGIVGYIERDGFFAELERIRKGNGTISAMRSQVEQEPDDLELHYKLALKLNDLGDVEGHDALIDTIRAKDPDGRTATGADLAWRSTVKEIFKSVSDAKDADLAPMYAFLAECKQDDALFAGWDWVSQIEYAKGNRVAMREAALKAWRHIPEDRITEWGTETAMKAWRMRDELSKKERKLALKIATQAVEKAEQWATENPEQAASEKVRRFFARGLNTLACCQHMNGMHAEASRTMTRALELDPENEQYQTRMISFK